MCSETAVLSTSPAASAPAAAPGWRTRLGQSSALRWLGGLAVLLLPGGILILALGAWLLERQRARRVEPPAP
jgi:predicted lipid-binding transport protein (Tim44 family)